MGAKADSCFVGLELRLCRGALFYKVSRVSFAIAAQSIILCNWLEAAGLSQTVQLIQPGRRGAGILSIELIPRLLALWDAL